MPYLNCINKKLILSLAILITCHLVFGNFLFFQALAEEGSDPNVTVVETPETSAPVIEQEPVMEEPVVIEEPLTTEEPTVTEEPTTTEEPAIEEEPTVTEEPTTTEEPATEPAPENPATPETATSTDPLIFEFPDQNTALSTPTVCGNGILETSEACDDGNLIDGDGCSSACTIEAAPVYDVPTGFMRAIDVNQLTMVATWQMAEAGADDSLNAGAQFLPSGQYEVDKPITLCALVVDNQGSENINSVSATINYPENILIGIDENGEKIGCGQTMSELALEPLNSEEALGLICEQIRNNNNNLITWQKDAHNNFTYDYEQICATDGPLKEGTAKVYCATANLSYADPAGDYRVLITAANNNLQIEAENSFKYLELSTFVNDFTNIEYGLIKLNQLKTLTGDNIFNSEDLNAPTIKNTGNTRLRINIWQNDFGLGQTDGAWNLSYQAKVGESAAFTSYQPEQLTALDKPLNLAETTNIDFSIFIKKFPETADNIDYHGQMTISADKVEYLTCE